MDLDFPQKAKLTTLLQADKPDVDEICRLFSASRTELRELEDVIAEFTLHDNEILVLWETKKNHASNSGTWMHSMLEHLLNGYKIEAGPMQGELDAAIHILGSMGNVEVYRTEWCIYAPDEDIAGSIDLVLKEKDSNVFHLIDWKRSEKLEQKYEAYGKHMSPPLHEVEDAQGHHYRLQLNIYKWILEKYYDVSIQSMKVVCVHPRYLPNGLVDNVPDLQSIVSGLMQCCRDKRMAASLQEPEAAASLRAPRDEIPDTMPFQVEETQDDVEKALEELMMEEDEDLGPSLAKRRRMRRGAASHALECKNMFQRSLEIIKDTLETYGRDTCLQPNTIMQNTRNMLASLQTKHPWMSDQFRRIILVAAHLSEGKIADKPMLPDATAVIWMVEGDRHMRVHKGFLYIYDDDGCFMPFGGIPPEAVLHRVHDFFTCLEGMFRRMKPEIRRSSESVANAAAADMQSFENEAEFFAACRTATSRRSETPAYSQRLDEDADQEMEVQAENQRSDSGGDGPWTLDMAEKAWKVSCALKQELMQTRMIGLLVEWCESEDKRSSTICYDDICFVYDRPDSLQPVDVIRKGPQNNCYVRIPHPLLDPVLEANMQRLQLFYERTFWCNLDVYRCFQAAIAIAKRGFNVDRCFIGMSPGGVGQSLYSLHLSEMYKQNHSYFDPNIWHLDEELRKQVESFAKCFILTGQEAPETSKKMHLDLYKKTLSGDGIMGRKPYGYSTRMFQMIGWTRLEVNRMMTFVGVSNHNFNSLFRRSFVWKAKARFVHRKFLTKYPEHEKDGIFEADPSLNKFLTTSQASIAGLKLQWAFEMDFNKDDCYQLIENYCNGGDGYLTEDVMRAACGLPVRVRQVQEEEGLGNILAGEQDSADEKDERDNEWTNLKKSIIAFMLDTDLDILTFYSFKKLVVKHKEHPNLAKADMWDQLLEHGVVRPAIVRQKTSKEKPGAFIPRMTFGSQLRDICPQPSLDAIRLEFEEEHDIGFSKRYAFACRGRSVNADILKNYYKANIPACKKGRRSAEQEEILNRYQQLIRKIDDHEKSINDILEHKKRRLIGKRSQEDDNIDVTKSDGSVAAMGSSMKRSLTVTYKYSEKQDYSVRARRYTVNGGVQSMSRRLQYHIVGSHTVDLDIQNCCLTLVQQIIAKTSPEPPLSEDLATLLDDVVKNRTEFVNKIGLGMSEGKEVINTVFNGGSPPPNLKQHELIIGLQKISLYVRWMACNLLHDDYMSLSDKKDKTFPTATVLSLMWTAVEDMILRSWTEHVLSGPSKPKHLSLHFDGLRVSTDYIGSEPEEYIKKCENVIHKTTGFDVKIVAKKHMSFMELVKEKGTHANSLSNVPPQLLEKGNCIPCAMWHVVPLSRQAIIAAISDSSLDKNVEAKRQLYRDYRSVASMSGVDLVCCPGLPEAHVKSYIIHFERSGFPHCLAVKLDGQGTNATILDGATVYKMSMAAVRDFHHAAVDGSTMVSYWKRDPKDKLSNATKMLLDMVAGANSSDSDEGAEAQKGDEEEVPVICDNILESLRQEAAEVRNNLKERSCREGGRRQCPMCPFRSFAQMRQLRTHIDKHHSKKNQYVCSGTKQIKVILALHDHAASSQTVAGSLLQTSAALMRATVQPSLSYKKNIVDKHIRLVLDADGPRYVNLTTIGSTLQVRRARYLYYTQAFADLLVREMVMGHAQATGVQ